MLCGVEKVWCSQSDLFTHFLVEDGKKCLDYLKIRGKDLFKELCSYVAFVDKVT